MRLRPETKSEITMMLRAPHSICHKVKTWRYRLSLSYLALRYLSRAAAVRDAEMNGGSPYELPLRGVGVGTRLSWGRSR